MNILKKMASTFVLILSGVTIVTAFYITVFIPKVHLHVNLLWQMIGLSAICALGDLIFYSKREISKKHMRIRMIIHYLFINVIVLSGGFLWNWINLGHIHELFVMLLLIAILYVSIMVVELNRGKKTAELLNKRLEVNYDEAYMEE